MEIYASKICAALAADAPGLIAQAENTYHRTTAAVADRLLADRDKRILLLAGPSSSGKTTTANLLRDRLLTAGHAVEVVSLDDFYLPPDTPGYPRLPNGALDFEAPEALDIPAVRACLSAVLRGEEYPMPRFDFRAGGRARETRPLCIPPQGYLIVEGLHALHPTMVEGISPAQYMGVFVSVSTNILRDDGSRLLSGRKLRFLRRLVRDSLYRNSDAARTYTLWQSVLAGEDQYLYPYRDRAAVSINSFHDYEVALLRPFAEPLLAAPDAPRTDYTAAVSAAMAAFLPLAPDAVPDTSLMREFIPGGVYESLY